MLNESSYDEYAGILTCVNGFQTTFQGKVNSAQEKIKYTSKPDLLDLFSKAGLEMQSYFGAWYKTTYHKHSEEIIILSLRSEPARRFKRPTLILEKMVIIELFQFCGNNGGIILPLCSFVCDGL